MKKFLFAIFASVAAVTGLLSTSLLSQNVSAADPSKKQQVRALRQKVARVVIVHTGLFIALRVGVRVWIKTLILLVASIKKILLSMFLL